MGKIDFTDILSLVFDDADMYKLAYKVGKELGKEAKQAISFLRGEVEWEDLSHAQKNLYLGGDREEYERIRGTMAQRYKQGGAYTHAVSKITPQLPTHRNADGRFFDYESF